MRSAGLWGLVLLVFGLGFVGCRGTGEEDAPLAEVDGAPITTEDFIQTYVTYLLNTGSNDTPAVRYRHLDNLIDVYLLAEEARRRGLDQDSAFQAYAERERQKALGTRFYEEAFLRTLPELTEQEKRRAFVNSKRQVVVRHLFFLDEEAARASYQRLEGGRDFLDEAQEVYGLSRYDSTAGFLGPIRYFSTDDAFAEAAFGLSFGAYSEPVRSRHGWHIIRVEDEIRNPLLTESEFQTRAEGLAGRERLRRRRIEGDRFVRTYMQQRDVQVAAEAIRSLQALIADLENTAPGAVRASDLRAALQRESDPTPLTPETVLASYEQGGERHAFTAADYLFWLDTLPFAEARHRPGASVGRALRNHVLAVAAEDEGLGDDPEVQRLAARAARTRLAVGLRAELRKAGTPDDEALLREAYDRLGMGDRAHVTADYALAHFESRAAAEAFQRRLDADPDLVERGEQGRYVVGDPLTEPSAYRQALRSAPLGVSRVVGLADGRWAVIRVDRRETVPISFEAARDTLAEGIGPYLNEIALVRQLRAEADLRLDTARFEALYDLPE